MIKAGRPGVPHRPGDTVPCGVCRRSMRYDTLGRHFSRNHTGIKKFVYEVKKQKVMSNFFKNPLKSMYITLNYYIFKYSCLQSSSLISKRLCILLGSWIFQNSTCKR